MNLLPNKTSLLALLLLVAGVLQSCSDKVVRTHTANSPIYQSKEDWRATDIQIEGARALQNPGKIYLYDRYLFVNERMRGVHIFDNTNPANPINLGFLPVLANIDMAVNNRVLYLDSYTDLLAFDLTNPASPRLMSRVEDVFNFNNYGMMPNYDPNYPASLVDAEKGIVIGWEVKKVTEESNNYYYYPLSSRNDIAVDFTSSVAIESAFGGSTGIGGSMARFTVFQNHLYILQEWTLDVFNVSGDPTHVRQLSLSRFGETLFPKDGNLFIGTTTGMIIYGLGDPSNPVWLSEFEHFAACDPVVVEGDRAYVTLSSGNTCAGNVDVLEVIDISDIRNPVLWASYPMANPKGLGIDQDLLFLCDGATGLKVLDKASFTPNSYEPVSFFPGIVTFDVIPYNGTLIMTAEEGIYQYDYRDPQNIVQVSHLPVTP
ncbi:MAG: hypothetical protein AAGN35_11340 [Bacteroidota bacterium]